MVRVDVTGRRCLSILLESTPAQQARSLEGRPLGRLPSGDIALNSFEGSRLESLIRTLSEERAPA